MISEISFDVQVIQDNDDLEPPEIFYINVSPVRTAIVQPERIAVRICGGIMNIRQCRHIQLLYGWHENS